MNIALVFPPLFANLVQPHSALPRLAAVLKDAGHSAHVLDLNLAYVQWLLEEGGWAFVQPVLDNAWQMLESSKVLEAPAQREYLDLVWAAERPLEEVQREFLAAARTLRDPSDGYIWQEYEGASRVISRLWTLLTYWSIWAGARGNQRTGTPGTYYGRTAVMSPEVLLQRLEAIQEDPSYAFCTQKVTAFVERHHANLLGFSVTTLSQLEPTLGILRALHARFGDRLKIVLGGNIITRLRSVLAAHPNLLKGVYAGIIYEGEIPLLQLAANNDRARIQNLIYVDNGNYYENDVGVPMPIDRIATPDFSDLDLKAYLAPEPVLPVVAGHGCDWKQCAFCNIALGYFNTQHRSPELVAEDMVNLHRRYGTHLFTLYQESISPERLVRIARALLNTGIDIRWEASSELEPGFSPEACELMYRSGCRCLHFGLESVDERVVRLMDRNITAKVADEVLRNTAAAGIMNAITVISGFPTETLAEAQRTARFIEERADVMHSVSVSVYYISRGSPVDLAPQRYGVSFRRDSAQGLQMAITEYDCTDGMTPAERHAHAIELSRTMQANGCVLPVDPPLLFAAHYETNKPAVIFEQSKLAARRREASDRAASVQAVGPRLRPGVILRQLAFPLDEMRSQFVHPLSGTDTPPPPVERSPGVFCLDSARDRVVRIPLSAYTLINLCDGRPEEEILDAFAETEHIPWEQAAIQQRVFLRLYGTFLQW